MSNKNNPELKLRYSIILSMAFGVLLLGFVVRYAGKIPLQDEAARLSTEQVQILITTFRTIVIGGFPVFALAHICAGILVLSYLRGKGKVGLSTGAGEPQRNDPSAQM
jgi:hypothetical protein